MRTFLPRRVLVLFGCLILASIVAAQGSRPITLKFSGTEYFHRWSKDNQHELTPRGQEDLQKWSDMLTINYYPQARDKDGDDLAGVANSVLENYKRNGALVMGTNSVPRTPLKPAEHYIAVAFTQPQFMEAAFARFVMRGGIGLSVVYSHRIYGAKARDQMDAWLKENGAKMEKELFALDSLPAVGAWPK